MFMQAAAKTRKPVIVATTLTTVANHHYGYLAWTHLNLLSKFVATHKFVCKDVCTFADCIDYSAMSIHYSS